MANAVKLLSCLGTARVRIDRKLLLHGAQPIVCAIRPRPRALTRTPHTFSWFSRGLQRLAVLGTPRDGGPRQALVSS